MQTTEDLLLSLIEKKENLRNTFVLLKRIIIPNNFQVMNGLISILKADVQNSHGFLPVR